MANDIPAHTLRISNRARSVRLQVTRHDGLVVIIPAKFDQRLIPGILMEKSDWIRRTLEKVRKEPDIKLAAMPEKLELRSVGETWMVVYRTEPIKHVRLEQQAHGRVLIVSGKVNDRKAVTSVLKAWLKGKAGTILPDWLQKLSLEYGLSYNGLTIRDQKTRWGSCSSLKHINLNLKLILLPAHLIDYVLIHELCHTRALSHSAVFWNLVGSYYPDYKTARKQIREISRSLPL
jgi:predicted metal-dependent hydrolase